MNKELITKLEQRFEENVERYNGDDFEKCKLFQLKHDMQGQEIFFCPEIGNYEGTLSMLYEDDIVFDVGAGDLRFGLMMSEKVKKVYAVEINPKLLGGALRTIGFDLPPNLIVICGNAFNMELPKDVTVITCLMLHRQHDFPQSWKKYRKIYCSFINKKQTLVFEKGSADETTKN